MQRINSNSFIWGVGVGILLCLLLALSSCVSAKIKTADGTEISYKSFVPFGNAVEAHAEWQGVGSLTISRDTAGAESTIEAILPAILP